jgi:hypothetical protein
MTLGEDLLLAAAVSLFRGYVADGAVSMLSVVPTHEPRHPTLCERKAGERQARISWRVLQGSEQ